MNDYIIHIEPMGEFYVKAGTNAEAKAKAWNSLTDAQRDSVAYVEAIPVQPEEVELFSADPDCLHWVKNAPGGGIRCVRCRGWFCF